ncbi:DNA-invertase hin [subsurface metagenome]
MTAQAIGYIRVSTSGQVEEGVSLEAQQAKINAWCIANDYELLDVFIDAGISGKNLNRKGLVEAIDILAPGTAIVVYSLSRLTRSTKDMLHLAEVIEDKQADLVSLSEKIDTTSAAGRMVFRMLAVLNEFERDQISERTKTALAHKKANGERIGTVPYGYRLTEDGKTLNKDENEQTVLTRMKRLRSKGHTLQAIADRLNKEGAYTRRGTVWRYQYIHSLLRAA